MFSNNENLKCIVSDDMNCIIYNQNAFLGKDAAELTLSPDSVEFSASFVLDRRPPDMAFNTVYITTDNEKVNLWNSTIAQLRRYRTCGKTVYIDASYSSNVFDNTIADILMNHGKDLKCIANVTENGGVRIKLMTGFPKTAK